MRAAPLALLLFSILPALKLQARVTHLTITSRTPVLNGQAFSLAGPYEKITGKVHFALNPSLPANAAIIDLALAPRNAAGDTAGEVTFTADFLLLKPIDSARSNHRLLYEVGNRGGKSLLRVFQKGTTAPDPTTAADFGDASLMHQGFFLLWMGWQWDVPEGRMRMDMPIASDHGAPILGLVRGNFIPNTPLSSGPLADRGHRAYPVNDPNDPTATLTVRNRPTDKPTLIPRNQWRFLDDNSIALTGGFQLGRIYDVVYRARDPRVLGTGLSGTRDLISFLKHSPQSPLPGLATAYGWGISQSGRFLRHFLYEGFNADEQGRIVFDGIFDEVGGAGRGSFNHRFGQASRDAEQFFNIHFPVDIFPFTDGPSTDPESNRTDALLARANAQNVAPKLFHLLSNSEYFNRAGSLIHTSPDGKNDIEPPANVRIYSIASGPHFIGTFPPTTPAGYAAPFNFLDRAPIIRALFQALDQWTVNGTPPPANQFPRLADGTLTTPDQANWPSIPNVTLPPPALITYRLDFGPDFHKGIVTFEPPHIGKPYPVFVPAVDADGNTRAGIRMPTIAHPIGTYAGWNFRHPSIGSPDQLNGEAGSFHPFAPKQSTRSPNDSRPALDQRYSSLDQYLGRVLATARTLIQQRLFLPQDLPDLIDQATTQYTWATTQ
jgi:hypothetical protein